MTAAVTPGREAEIEIVADAIDLARFQHPEYPRERPRPFSEADRPDREYARRMAKAAIATYTRLAAKPADEWTSCILLNQVEIMGAISLLLRYAMPGLIGKAGELDLQRDDLLQRHKATQVALSPTREPKR